MRLPGIGLRQSVCQFGLEQALFDGGKTYKVMLPKDIPEADFWSFTL